MSYSTTWTNYLKENKKERKAIASVVCVDEEMKILIIKRSPGEDSKQGYWDLPGGHIDDDDNSIEAGVSRELYEETGLESSLTNLKYIDKIQTGDADKYYYTTTQWSGDVKFVKNPKTGIIEHSDHKWATIEEIKSEKALELRTFPLYLLDKAVNNVKDE